MFFFLRKYISNTFYKNRSEYANPFEVFLKTIHEINRSTKFKPNSYFGVDSLVNTRQCFVRRVANIISTLIRDYSDELVKREYTWFLIKFKRGF